MFISIKFNINFTININNCMILTYKNKKYIIFQNFIILILILLIYFCNLIHFRSYIFYVNYLLKKNIQKYNFFK